MKTRVLSLLLLAATLATVSCSPKYYANRNRVPDEMPDGGSYTERVVPVVTKIAPDGQVTLRFYDSMPNVAYISAADFQSIVLPGSTMTVTHTGAGQYTLTNADATATVNINDDVFMTDGFEAFTNQMGLLQPGMANVYYDGMPFVRYKSVAYLPLKATTTLDMGAYGIDLHADGKGAVYFPFAFNGEKVVANLSVNEVELSEIDPDYNKPLVARTTRPADLTDFNYKELCFAMDHFYGYPGRIKYNDALKAKGLDKALEEDIESGPAIKKLLLSEKFSDYMLGMVGLTGVYFDGHTAMDISSALGKITDHPELYKEYQAGLMANQGVMAMVMSAVMDMRAMVADGQAVEALRPKVYGEGVTYVKKGDTAVCVFDSFNERNEQAWKDYYAGTGPMPTVENAPNDITANGGGSADIVLAMTSLILDKSYISQDNSLTGQRSIVEYEVDRNFNGVFDAADKDVRYDLNFAVLTSPMSFSCGNLFPSILKDAGVPVMGATSGGGACAIQAMCTADGFCFQISSFRARLNTLDGDNIDGGVTPDIPIAADGTVEVKLSEENSMTVKDYSKYFDIDYLRSLLESR